MAGAVAPASREVKSEPQLVRGLTLTHTIALVVGTVIGTGVFLKAAIMAQAVGTPYLVLAAWLVAGLMTLVGALAYAELGALLPHAGGEYVYLREAYGKLPAFLGGWMHVVVASTGAIASLAAGFATFLVALFPLESVWVERTFNLLGQTIHWQFGTRQIIAVGIILLVSAINCAGVVLGGRIQSVLTTLKVLSILVIAGGVFAFSNGATLANLATPVDRGAWSGFTLFSAAVLAALWAYDGWYQTPMVAAEIKHPERNLPRALIGGLLLITFLYCLANFAYLYALPFDEVANANSTAFRQAPPVASKAASTFLGPLGTQLVGVIFLISTLGALNGSILQSARTPYAMARDGLLFRSLSGLSQSTRVPVLAIAAQAVWASILAMSGTYDQLTDYVVFATWIFFALTTGAVFVLRRKMPDAPRPFRVPGYPVLPIVFILVAAWLVVTTLYNRPVESAAGLILIGLGFPLYLYFRKKTPGEGHA
ncbi:MAG: amino acid permease [Acidobacteriales bacterium]|nr:amino acid permease [Terriglobales bacterium]